MWAELIENIKQNLAGKGTDHHNSDCQVGEKGGLRISKNKKSRSRNKGTQGMVMSMWFWLLNVGAGVTLRNVVVFLRREDVTHGEGIQ